jgi:branched-chain amino acid transport system permease protein
MKQNKYLKLFVLLILFVAIAVPFFAGSYVISLITLGLIYAIFAMSIDILAGYAGRTSLCHGAIFGSAAYATIYGVTILGSGTLAASCAGVGIAILIALIFALLAVRTSGVYFLLLTLALGMIVWGVCQRWTSITGGDNGLRGSIRPEWLISPSNFFYFVLCCSLILAFLMWRFVNSPFGLSLKGIRESDSRMRSLGYNTTQHLILGFMFSGLAAGVAGVLYAFFNSFVSPSSVALTQSVKGLLMAILGGIGTLYGGFVGAGALIVLENLVSSFTPRWSFVMGLIFVLTMIFLPAGIVGKLKMQKK